MSLRIGVVGCGPIADSYLAAARRFPALQFVACAGRGEPSPSVQALAERHDLRPLSYPQMLQDDGIAVVLVLTPAQAHFQSALAAIEAGKHVYLEKPLATSVADARTLVVAAADRGVQLGCAPDTVLGANIQTAAARIDGGDVGVVTSGIAALGSRGMEHWHPDPGHLYQPGGGPILDKAPYYVAALVTLLGPVDSVRADGRRAFDQRTITAPGSPKFGQSIPVDVLTTVHAIIGFRSGAMVTLMASWDVAGHALPDLELYGTAGSIRLDDPNWFGGPVHVCRNGNWHRQDTIGHLLGAITMTDVGGMARADHRGIGLAEMVVALSEHRHPLCSGGFALHVLEVLAAILSATATGERVAIAAPDKDFALPRLATERARALVAAP